MKALLAPYSEMESSGVYDYYSRNTGLGSPARFGKLGVVTSRLDKPFEVLVSRHPNWMIIDTDDKQAALDYKKGLDT